MDGPWLKSTAVSARRWKNKKNATRDVCTSRVQWKLMMNRCRQLTAGEGKGHSTTVTMISILLELVH